MVRQDGEVERGDADAGVDEPKGRGCGAEGSLEAGFGGNVGMEDLQVRVGEE